MSPSQPLDHAVGTAAKAGHGLGLHALTGRDLAHRLAGPEDTAAPADQAHSRSTLAPPRRARWKSRNCGAMSLLLGPVMLP